MSTLAASAGPTVTRADSNAIQNRYGLSRSNRDMATA